MIDFDSVVVGTKDKEYLEFHLQVKDNLLCYLGIPVYVEENLPAGIALAILKGRIVGIIKNIGQLDSETVRRVT